MGLLLFFLLLVVAAIAAGVQILIGGTPTELRARSFLPKLIGG